MSESKRKSRRGYAVAIGLVLGLPLLYVLSIGPYSWLVFHDYADPRTVFHRTFYEPLYALAGASPAFRELLVWYMRLFEI